MRAVRAITFDVGGTLDGPGVPWRPRFETIYRAAGIDERDEVLARAFYDADDHLHERHSLADLDLAATVRLQVADTLRALNRHSPALVERIASAFVAEAHAALRAARPMLALLRKEFHLGVVSNSYGNLRDVLRHEGLLDLFEVVIDSREVGLDKPDPRIFHAACRAMSVAPAEVAHVGDSIPRDVKGAQAAGLVPIWYAPDGVEGPGEPGVLRLRRLDELASLLARVPS